ncbi:MAG: hypothetical protein AAGA32_15245 [Pseudomonadota bacterium]
MKSNWPAYGRMTEVGMPLTLGVYGAVCGAVLRRLPASFDGVPLPGTRAAP